MKVVSYLLGNVLYFVSYLIPKSSAIWIFGSWGGQEFADNPKYLYDYVRNNCPEIKRIWLTRNTNVYQKLKKEGHNVFMCNSIKGIWFSCRACIGVTSHGMIDLNRYACARLKIVQTWHGIPIKPILLSDPKKSAIAKRKQLELLSSVFLFLKKELNFNKNLLICSSSEYVTDILKICFGAEAPLKNTGFPRLDGVFNSNDKSEIYNKIQFEKNRGKSIGIYMPTYRRDGEYDIISFFLLNLKSIEEFLIKNNQVLFLKIHPFEYYKIKDLEVCENIHLIVNEDIEGDIYSVLGLFDFLISDYSSIIFDFLVLARPIYLLVPDREDYISSNGKLVYDYVNIGLPIFQNWEELLKNYSIPFSELCSENIVAISKRFHKYRDGNSSKRVFEEIIKNI